MLATKEGGGGGGLVEVGWDELGAERFEDGVESICTLGADVFPFL